MGLLLSFIPWVVTCAFTFPIIALLLLSVFFLGLVNVSIADNIIAHIIHGFRPKAVFILILKHTLKILAHAFNKFIQLISFGTSPPVPPVVRSLSDLLLVKILVVNALTKTDDMIEEDTPSVYLLYGRHL